MESEGLMGRVVCPSRWKIFQGRGACQGWSWSGVPVAAVAHQAPEGVCEAQEVQVARGKEEPSLSSQGLSNDTHLMSEAGLP